MWMCMRCQRELPTARVQVPHPRPSCPNCCVPFAWEVDIRHAVERWVCSRCPFAGPAHPLALQQLACSPSTSDAERIGQVDSIGGPCAVSVPDASLPATPPHAPSAPLNGVSLPGAPLPEAETAHELPGAPSGDAEPAHAALRHVVEAPARNWVHAEPPPIPLPQATNSCVYMPLLLDAAGLLHGRARGGRTRPLLHGGMGLSLPSLHARSCQCATCSRQSSTVCSASRTTPANACNSFWRGAPCVPRRSPRLLPSSVK